MRNSILALWVMASLLLIAAFGCAHRPSAEELRAIKVSALEHRLLTISQSMRELPLRMYIVQEDQAVEARVLERSRFAWLRPSNSVILTAGVYRLRDGTPASISALSVVGIELSGNECSCLVAEYSGPLGEVAFRYTLQRIRGEWIVSGVVMDPVTS